MRLYNLLEDQQDVMQLQKELMAKISNLPTEGEEGEQTARVIDKIEQALRDVGAGGRVANILNRVVEIKDEDVQKATRKVAKIIADQNIVGIYQGRNELGKRALGNRSFLYDPRDAHGKEKINLLKSREWCRPTAGTVLFEHRHDWFDLKSKDESEYMSYVFQVRKKDIPGITHVDNSCRIQTLRQKQNYHYYNLINEFYKLTGIPILLNTSLNLGGKPLANSVEDVMDIFAFDYNFKFNYIYFPEIGKLYTK